MGGTTTDVAIIVDARPVVRADGAVIGGWRTMVQAINVHTSGLGGDSEVQFDREARLKVGTAPGDAAQPARPTFPRGAGRAHPARRRPAAAALCRPSSAIAIPDARRPRISIVWSCGFGRHCRDPRAARRPWPTPRRAWRRCVGWWTVGSPLWPDLLRLMHLHVLGRHDGWSRDAARLGAAILATEERNVTARRTKDSSEALSERVYELVVRAGGARGVGKRAGAGSGSRAAQRPLGAARGPSSSAPWKGGQVSRLLDAQPRLPEPPGRHRRPGRGLLSRSGAAPRCPGWSSRSMPRCAMPWAPSSAWCRKSVNVLVNQAAPGRCFGCTTRPESGTFPEAEARHRGGAGGRARTRPWPRPRARRGDGSACGNRGHRASRLLRLVGPALMYLAEATVRAPSDRARPRPPGRLRDSGQRPAHWGSRPLEGGAPRWLRPKLGWGILCARAERYRNRAGRDADSDQTDRRRSRHPPGRAGALRQDQSQSASVDSGPSEGRRRTASTSS